MFRPPSVTFTAGRTAIGLVAGAVLAAGSAQAQSASSTLSSYRAGYGGVGLSGLSAPVSPSLIAIGSQYGISDGVSEAGAAGSVFTTQTSSSQTSGSPSNSQGSGGTGQSSSGVGQAAVANARAPLAVVERSAANAQGAAPPAPNDLELNGKLNLDGGR